MAPDRRFGLPHPSDVEPPEDSSSRPRSGLWASLKRALGASAAEPPVGDRPALPLPTQAPRPNPIPPPAKQPTPAPAMTPPRGANAPIAEDVPFLADPPVTEPSPPVSAPAANGETESTPELAPAADFPEIEAEKPTRLARGLASFSRENAQREKKFAHLIRDAHSATKKSPPGSRKPG